MMLCCVAAAAALTAQAAPAPKGLASTQEYKEGPFCGHHQDIWGFSVDLPPGQCADSYLHGIALRLSEKDAAVARLIVAFAMANATFLTSSEALAQSYVDAAADSAVGPVSVLVKAPVVVGGVAGERWRYAYREKASGQERVVDLVAVLRAIRPAHGALDYYQYAFYLETTPVFYPAERPVFESVLKSLTFSVPER